LPTAYKLYANIIKDRLNEHLEDEMEDEQCGFRKRRSCTDAILTVQQIIEKRKEHNLPLFILFIDSIILIHYNYVFHIILTLSTDCVPKRIKQLLFKRQKESVL